MKEIQTKILSGDSKEVLKQLRLDVPQITELALRLNKKGIDISSHTLKIEDMVESLCLYI